MEIAFAALQNRTRSTSSQNYKIFGEKKSIRGLVPHRSLPAIMLSESLKDFYCAKILVDDHKGIGEELCAYKWKLVILWIIAQKRRYPVTERAFSGYF